MLPTCQIIIGDALEKLRELPGESVQCCITSPPYWGLRDYGTAQWEGGDDDCDHATRDATRDATSTLIGTSNKEGFALNHYKHQCGKCGAKRIDSQLGLEKTPEEYVAKMVEVFREVRRVLRKDGTLWLNLGDSYCGTGSKGDCTDPKYAKGRNGQKVALNNKIEGLKQKDLVGIPWRVAFALQADGWWLRSDIIWAKPNPMPESVTDRPTKAHEYLFLLSKSSTYFYDAEAIKEPATFYDPRLDDPNFEPPRRDRDQIGSASRGGGPLNRRTDKQRGHGRRHAGFNDRWDAMEKSEQCSGFRNKRSVWTVATAPYPEAHFATYPPDLIKPCILAGSKIGDTVLDPFGGSGTTGQVALELGRSAILIELNPKYAELIHDRCNITPGLALAI